MTDWAQRLVALARERWSTRSGLLLALLITAIALLGIFSRINIADISVDEALLIFVALCAVAVAWIITRLPRTPRGRVGFGIAITFEKSAYSRQLRTDFVIAMRDLLSKSPQNLPFALIEFSQSTSRGILEFEDAATIAKRAKLTNQSTKELTLAMAC